MKKVNLILILLCCGLLFSACGNDTEDAQELSGSQNKEDSENTIDSEASVDTASVQALEYDESNRKLVLLDVATNNTLEQISIENNETIDAYREISDGYAVIRSTYDKDVNNTEEMNGIVISIGSSENKSAYEYITYDADLQEKDVISLKSMISENLLNEIQECEPEPQIDSSGQNIAWSTANGVYVLNVESGEQMVHALESDDFSWYEIIFISEDKLGFYRVAGKGTETTRYGYWDLAADKLFYAEETDYSPSLLRASGNYLVLNDSEDPTTGTSSGKVVIYDCEKNQSNVFPVDNTESTFATVTKDGEYLIVYNCTDDDLTEHKVRVYQLSSQSCVYEDSFTTENGVKFYDFCNEEDSYLLIGNENSGKVVYHAFTAE